MNISVIAGQFPIGLDIQHNLQNIVSLVQQANPNELVVLPEGALSGYSDDLSFLNQLDTAILENAMNELEEVVYQKRIHLIVGSLLFEDGHWVNAALYLSPERKRFIYRKVNLATNERGYLTAGSELPIFPIHFEHISVNIGIQLCREIRFPEQWRYLALSGADLFVYLTNAVNPMVHLSVWRSHLISRAAENQRFVISSNNAHPIQHCPTMIISPKGEVLKEIVSDRTEVLRFTLDLSEISNWYLSQCRTDVIGFYYKGQQVGLEGKRDKRVQEG